MESQKVWFMFESLPTHAKQEVIDFIEFLQKRYPIHKSGKHSEKPKLSDAAFIGIWKDREDLRNSSSWLRDVRRKEWNR